MRALTKLRLAMLAAAALVVAAGFYIARIAGPGLKITRHDDQLIVEPYFLEYNLGISRLLLEDLNEHKVVFEAASKPETEIDLVRLSPGPLNVAYAMGPNAQLVPAHESPAVLVRGHEYRLTVWGNNGFGNIASSTTTNRL